MAVCRWNAQKSGCQDVVVWLEQPNIVSACSSKELSLLLSGEVLAPKRQVQTSQTDKPDKKQQGEQASSCRGIASCGLGTGRGD